MRASSAGKHIVDVLIEERAPRLAAGPLWPVAGPALRALLGYRKARRMADAIAPLKGTAALDYVSALLHLKLSVRGLEHLPRAGRCILVCNHPTGIADGVAVYDALKAVRADLSFFANADAHRVCRGFDDVLIPVAWPAEKRTLQSTKLTLRRAREALERKCAVVIFPAGALARRIKGIIQDPDWEHSAVALARKHEAPISPLHISGPFPFLFHFFDRFSKELRDITLFHELLNKAGGSYRLTLGMPIDPRALNGSNEEITARLKHYVERILPGSPGSQFTHP